MLWLIPVNAKKTRGLDVVELHNEIVDFKDLFISKYRSSLLVTSPLEYFLTTELIG